MADIRHLRIEKCDISSCRTGLSSVSAVRHLELLKMIFNSWCRTVGLLDRHVSSIM